MPTMIETLIGTGIARPDEKRLIPTRRPLPSRPRDLLELFVTLGNEATIPTLNLSADFRQADPRHITYLALSRWPTPQELASIPAPYVPITHLRTLLLGQEFRASLVRRICDAYPERPRLFYVQIPRCAGDHFLNLANTMHPILPAELAHWRRGDQARFIPLLGSTLSRFTLTRTIQIVLPTLAPFVQTSSPPTLDPALPWSINPPPRRPGDRLFTIIREPTSLVLSQVNAILTDLRSPTGQEHPAAARRTRLDPLPPLTNTNAWKAIGRKILASLDLHNPICHALGDGTAESALKACRHADVEIADLTRYTDWVTYTWDVQPEPPTNVSEQIFTKQDLGARENTRLAEMIAEDLALYAPIGAALAVLPELRTSLRGRDL